jgi:predicted SnoaL-like aldol condensation-catalyzing enzyme
MSTEENKALVQRLIEEVWNQGNLAIFDEFYAPDFRFHDPGLPQVRTREEDKEWIAGVLHAFPDFFITSEDVIAEGDRVAVRLTARGTNTGDLGTPAPHPATGKYVTITGNVIARVANGQFVEIWHQVDWLGLFQQLGLIPAPAQAS